MEIHRIIQGTVAYYKFFDTLFPSFDEQADCVMIG
jgi:hypothetical protein